MKKVFFIGKFNDAFEEIKTYLAQFFSVQVCVDNLSVMLSVLKLSQPDILVLNTTDMGETKEEFIKALKDYGELGRKELDEILGGEPLMLDDIHEVDSMYVGRGRLYFSYLAPERDNRAFEREISVEDYDDYDIRLIYDYLINN